MPYRTHTGAALARGALLIACLAAGRSLAQDFGDTPYVPTPQNVVERMLEIAKVGPRDYVIDLGSGDGRLVITAAKRFGARGFGVDLDRRLVRLSNRLAAEAGVAQRAVFYERDLYQTDLGRATVLTMYLLPEVNLMVRPKLLAELRPGTRIVSHDYDMGEWLPDFQTELAAPGKTVGVGQRSKIFYWVVPARAAGRWSWRLTLDGKVEEFELALSQQFQKIEGTLNAGGSTARMENARLTGEAISFSVRAGEFRYDYSGRIMNRAIEGTVRVNGGGRARELSWKAGRIEAWEPRFTAPDAPPVPG